MTIQNLTAEGVNATDNYTSVYDITGGNNTWKYHVADKQSFSIEVVSGAFTYNSVSYGTNLGGTLDGTITLQEGVDGENFQTFANSTALTLDTATKKGGWKKDNINSNWIQLSFVKNNLTSGTIRIMIVIKDK